MSAPIRTLSEDVGLVPHVMNRIYQLLPVQSGLSLIDVEDDTAIFLNARRALINISEADKYNEILLAVIDILDSLNEADNYLVLKQRSVSSLSSVLIMIRLLADLSEVNWSAREPSSRKNSMESNVSNSSTSSSFGVGFASVSTEFHTVQPTKLIPDIAARAISLIAKIKSANALTQELALMNGKTVSQATAYEDISTRPLIDQIDHNCESILKFLAAANPLDYFHFITSKVTILKHNVSNESDFAPYLELFSCVYLNPHLLLEYLRQIRVIIGSLKRDSYRQLVFSFLLKSIKLWIQSRPNEFITASSPDSNVSMEAETLFDEVVSSTDTGSRGSSGGQQQRFRSSHKFLAFLLTLHPKSLSQFLTDSGSSSSKTSALKKITNINLNKKQKVLSSVVKQLSQPVGKDFSDTSSLLESLDFMVFITNVASSTFTSNPKNVLVTFSKSYYSLISKVLVPITSTHPIPFLLHASSTEAEFFNDLRLDYFSSICVLNPLATFPDLLKILHDENSSLDSLNIASSIFKVYSATRLLDSSNQEFVLKALPALRAVMVRVSIVVKASSYSGSVYEEDNITGLYKTTSVSSSSDHPTPNYKSLIPESITKSYKTVESISKSSFSSGISSTPKAERFKETTKSFFRSHSSSNQSTSTNDELKSLDSKDSSLKAAVISRQILTNSFNVFKKYPHRYLYSFEDSSAFEKICWMQSKVYEFGDPIITGLNDSNSKLRMSAKDFIHSFYVTTNITDDLDSTVAAFTGCSQIAFCIASYILNNFSSDSRKKFILESFVRMLELRIILHGVLSQYTHFKDIKEAELQAHHQVASSIEETLLFCLTTADQETYGLIKRGIRAHAQEFQLNDQLVAPEADSNLEFFKGIASDKMVTTGSVALHKNIQKYLSTLAEGTTAVRDAFTRIYDKWYKFAKSEYSTLSAAELTDFRNFASFIASTSGLFVNLDTPKDIKEAFSGRVENFISQQLTMLSNDNLVTRENAKEILASEMNSKAYPSIIRLLKPLIESFYKKPTLSTMDVIVCELSIILVKAMLDGGDDISLFLISVDVVECATMLASIVDSLTVTDKVTLRLQMRCSLLFHKISIHSPELKIQNAYKIRNSFLRFVYKWFENALLANSPEADTDSVNRSSHASKDLQYVYIDLTLESAKAMAVLLDNLILEAPRVQNEHELKFYKSRVFSVYFNTLLKALENYTDPDKFGASIKHKVSTISEHITAALTNLLKSNVDVGLSYALPIGYHTNLKVRVSFLKVFTSIIESYGENARSIEEAKRVVIAAFGTSLRNLSFISSIGRSCPPQEAAGVTSSILAFANSFNQTAPIVSFLLEEEIKAGSSYTDILRRNSFASRSLSAFGRIKGNEYLIQTLKPILTEIKESDLELEVEKIDPDDPEAEKNLGNFIYFLTRLVDVIVDSIDKVPIEFKKVCQTISESVHAKFPNYRLIAVGSFIFLRFFCPAIVSPESERIVDIPNRQTQRKFLLLAKTLQNMANGSISSIKWPIIKKRETELNILNDRLTKYLDEISTADQNLQFEVTVPDTVDDGVLNFVHGYLYENWPLLRVDFSKSYESYDNVAYGRTMAQEIMDVLEVVGQPIVSFGYEIPSTITPEHTPELYDFMSKYSMKDVAPILDSDFVRQDITQDGLQLLVFSYSDYFKIKTLDEEIVLYRFFQVASKVWDQKFAFVIDCTGFKHANVYSLRGLALFERLSPPHMTEHCVGLYYYNLSTQFYQDLMLSMKSPSFFSNSPNFPSHFRSAMDDKKTVLNLGLSKSTIKSYHDVRVKFNDVSMYQEDFGRFVPVVVKIGHENLQICQTTAKRIKMRDSIKSVFINDVFKLDDIESVKSTETTKVPNETTLTMKDGSTIILTSPKYLEIMRLLYFTRNRTSNTTSDSLLIGKSERSTENLLGQMFNVIFLGLTSSSAEIRALSYNLLVVTHQSFHVDLGRELHQLHEIYFPRGNNAFVVSMSQRLAQKLPYITFEFINAFFKIYSDSISATQRLSAILYVSPWIENVYEHVFKSDDERGPDLVAEIIRNFLSVSTIDPAFLSAFNSSFWSKLCLQERISSILVNEIVLSAIDRESEGSDWRRTISLLTSTPTIELFTCVIKRLRDISHIPFPDEKGSYSIAAHSNWIEITVLVQMAVSLVFDNHIYAEMFLPDVFYIVTILVDVGPLDLRIASHQLLLNLLQAFLSDPQLTKESRDVIHATVEQFTTHRSRLLFGLTRDNDESFPSELSKFTTKISTVESLVTLLLDAIDGTSSFQPNKIVWISRWNRYVIDAALRKDSVLRGRALLLLGVLSRRGINDNMVIKILEMVSEDATQNVNDPRYNYLAICTVFSLSKVTLGLIRESKLFTKLFWLAISITHSSHTALYQGGMQFTCSALLIMSQKMDLGNRSLIDVIIDDKKTFEPLMEKVDTMSGMALQRNNFDFVLLHLASKGLQIPHSRASSIQTIKHFFLIRYNDELKRKSLVGKFDYNCVSYLLFLFVLLKQNELKEVLDEAGIEEEGIYINEETHLPRILADFILSGTDESHMALTLVSIYFNEGNPNDKAMMRFIQVLKFVSKRHHKLLVNVYYEIQITLRKVLQSGTNIDLISEIFDLASIAFVSEGYDENERYKAITDELLLKFSITGIRNYKFPDPETLKKAVSESEITEGDRGNLMKPIILRIFESSTETA